MTFGWGTVIEAKPARLLNVELAAHRLLSALVCTKWPLISSSG